MAWLEKVQLIKYHRCIGFGWANVASTLLLLLGDNNGVRPIPRPTPMPCLARTLRTCACSIEILSAHSRPPPTPPSPSPSPAQPPPLSLHPSPFTLSLRLSPSTLHPLPFTLYPSRLPPPPKTTSDEDWNHPLEFTLTRAQGWTKTSNCLVPKQ